MQIFNIINREGGLIPSSTTEFSSIGTTEPDPEYNWNPGSLVILILFAATQVLIWSFFIFCYFARGKRHSPTTIPPSIAIIDLPPDYEIAVSKNVFIQFPMDPDPPSYTEACANCISGSQFVKQPYSSSEKSRCSCTV